MTKSCVVCSTSIITYIAVLVSVPPGTSVSSVYTMALLLGDSLAVRAQVIVEQILVSRFRFSPSEHKVTNIKIIILNFL